MEERSERQARNEGLMRTVNDRIAAIDELKVSVPLWKKEFYEGGEEWIGRGS